MKFLLGISLGFALGIAIFWTDSAHDILNNVTKETYDRIDQVNTCFENICPLRRK